MCSVVGCSHRWFRPWLLATESKAAEARALPPHGSGAHRLAYDMLPKVLLLVVENEAVVRLDLEDTLRDAGFSLVVAVRGDLAIAELEQNAARFGAVLTSIKLGPGPDGWDVARRARELVHGMPVIYMSSSTDGEWTSQGVPRSILIAKPFAAAQVVTAVATLLNQSTP